MDRRSFLALSPAFPVAAASATLTLKREGEPPVELDVSILKTQPGDCVILSAPGPITQDIAQRLKDMWEHGVPGTKAVILSDGMKVDGVLRGPS